MNWNPCVFFNLDPYIVKIIHTVILAVYIFIGYWIAHLSWRMWTVKGNNPMLAFLLFPHAKKVTGDPPEAWDPDKKRFDSSEHYDTWRNWICEALSSGYSDKVIYYICTIVFWLPFKILPNLGYIFYRMIVFVLKYIRTKLVFASKCTVKRLTEVWYALIPKDVPEDPSND